MEYYHEPLKLSVQSIRLLQIRPGTGTEQINCRITQYALQRQRKYIAISYTWGQPKTTHTIEVNGRPFRIRSNLFSLLHMLRQRKETRLLWIDALCINQADLEERNFHVQLMNQIYERAESAIVWLGLPSLENHERLASNLLLEASAEMKATSSPETFVRQLLASRQQSWQALERMCQREYWTRTWIIQEFLKSARLDVICGRIDLDWKLFESLIEVLRTLSVSELNRDPAIRNILRSIPYRLTVRRLAHRERSSSLEELLTEFYDSDCTEIRDKIYGFLGVAADCGEDTNTGKYLGPKPNYARHVVEVYLDVLAHLKMTSAERTVAPKTVYLLQNALRLSSIEIAQYLSLVRQKFPDSDLRLLTWKLTPDYVGKISHTISWTSPRDLGNQLNVFPWGNYVGFAVRHNSLAPPPTQSRHRRRSSGSTTPKKISNQAISQDLPEDLISVATNTADFCESLSQLDNMGYLTSKTGLAADIDMSKLSINSPEPSNMGLQLPAAFLLSTDPTPCRNHSNPTGLRPLLVIEKGPLAQPVRLGFACTDTRRGDLLCQFAGLDITLIVRQVYGGFALVGRAFMLRHAGLTQSHTEPAIDSRRGSMSGKADQMRRKSSADSDAGIQNLTPSAGTSLHPVSTTGQRAQWVSGCLEPLPSQSITPPSTAASSPSLSRTTSRNASSTHTTPEATAASENQVAWGWGDDDVDWRDGLDLSMTTDALSLVQLLERV